MDKDESAENEEDSSPPLNLLALSVQNIAQEGLWDRISYEVGEMAGVQLQPQHKLPV